MIYTYTDYILGLKLITVDEDGTKTLRKDILSESQNIIVSVENQCGYRVDFKITDDMVDIDNARINLKISQEYSKYLQGLVSVQINGEINGNRWACDIADTFIGENLLDEVIVYE